MRSPIRNAFSTPGDKLMKSSYSNILPFVNGFPGAGIDANERAARSTAVRNHRNDDAFIWAQSVATVDEFVRRIEFR
jgi:hypothetical protein